MIGYMMAWAISALLLFVGVAAWVAPRWLAFGYGVRAQDASAAVYVRATGARDLILGVIVALMAYHGRSGILVPTLAWSSLVALADLWLVLTTPGGRRIAGVVHGSSAVLLLVAAACVAVHR